MSIEMNEFIFIRSDRETVKLNLNDIVYIEGMKDYIKIVTISGISYKIAMNVKCAFSKLPKIVFRRIQKSFIINVNKINKIINDEVVMDDCYLIPIGRKYMPEFKEFIEAFLFKR